MFVGICAILVSGTLFWLGIGALATAWRDAGAALPLRPGQRFALAEATVAPRDAPTPADSAALAPLPTPDPLPTSTPLLAVAAAPPTSTAEPARTATPSATAQPGEDEGRDPWILLPQPRPGSTIAAGPVVVEARGRGDAEIAQMRLELDGTDLNTSLERRGESIWRASSAVSIAAGRHTVRAFVVDANGRTGSYRWTFETTP